MCNHNTYIIMYVYLEYLSYKLTCATNEENIIHTIYNNGSTDNDDEP